MATTNRTPERCSVFASALLLLAPGCADVAAEGDRVRPDDDGVSGSTGEMRAHFEAQGSVVTACGDAAGIRLALAGPEGQAEECEEAFVQVGESRYVADCFLVVAPGEWRFTELSAVDAAWDALPCCTSQHPDRVTVMASETTEVAASIACAADDNGGLDVDVTFDQPPAVSEVTVLPSLSGATCVPFALTALASDPEGDPFRLEWAVASAPANAGYSLEAIGSTAAFATQTLGDYVIRVSAVDEVGAAGSLDVPLAVDTSGGPATCDTDAAVSGLLGISIDLGL